MKKQVSSILLAGLLLSGCSGNNTTTPSATSTTPAAAATPSAPTPTTTLGELKAEEVTLTADHRGNPNSAFQFKGDQGLPVEFNLNPDALPQCTLVTWARYTGEPGGVQQVISHDDGGYDRSLGLDDRGGQWGWSCFAGNQGVLGGFPVRTGEWTFLAVVYDGNKTTLYAGEQKAEVADAQLGSGQETLNLGANPSYGEYFTGDVEPVMVFDRALTEEEVRALMRLE